MIRVFEAFAGVGCQHQALKNINIDFEVVGISEIDKYAIKSYEALHGKVDNYGDISKINPSELPNFDLFTYSFPCQDISICGKKKGFAKGSDTRSSLLWECERIIAGKRPKYLLMENVKNLVGKNNLPHFKEWLKILEDMGYKNYWKVLDGKDYGVPQHRERVFCVSILNPSKDFIFPKKEPLNIKLRDILEGHVDEKFYLNQKQVERIKMSTYNVSKRRVQEKDWSDTLCARDYKDPKCVKVWLDKQQNDNGADSLPSDEKIVCEQRCDEGLRFFKNNICGTIRATNSGGDKRILEPDKRTHNENDSKVIQIGQFDTPTRKNSSRYRVYDKDGISPCLSCMGGGGLSPHVISAKEEFGRIRKLTPRECWRLMGFSDNDIDKAFSGGCSNSQLYKQAGNGIIVTVLERIFANMFA